MSTSPSTDRPSLAKLSPRPSAAAGANEHPLSFLQESLWLLHALAPQQSIYNETQAWRLRGPLAADRLARALRALAQRHPALRTVFVETPAGLRGVVREEAALELEVVEPELGELASEAAADLAAARARAEALLAAHHARPFAIDQAPPVRAVLIRVVPGESLFALTAHHLVLDGWSFGILFAELRMHLRELGRSGELAQLPPLAITYGELAARERRRYQRGELSAQLDFWKRALQGTPDLLALPLDRPRPAAQSYRGATYAMRVPRAKLAALFERARRATGATEFQVLFAAYAALLHRESGQDRLAVGTALLGRSDAEALAIPGCFVNTAAIPFAVEETTTFGGLLGALTEIWGDVLAHQEAPFPKVLESLGAAHDPSHSPVFQTMMSSLGKRRPLALGGGVIGTAVAVPRRAAKFELLVYVTEISDVADVSGISDVSEPNQPNAAGGREDGFELEVEYQTEILSEATVARLLSHYLHLLEHLDAHFDLPLATASILPEGERRQLLEEWDGARVTLPETTVIDEIEAQARRTPEAIAVDVGGAFVTYAELHRTTNRLARALLAERLPGRDFVGVYMERSLDMVLALVSIMKAGLAYVPIDPEYPADRIRYMIEDSQVSLVLTQEHHRAALADGAARVVTLDELQRALVGALDSDSDLTRALTFDSRAYMIYTSGSTGRPKGVINRHGSLYNRLWWMQSEYALGAADRVLQKTPFSFDVSVWEFFWPLMVGARLVVAKPGGHRDADYLKRLIHQKQITTLHFVPSMLNVFLEEDELAVYCASLRQVFCSGEALSYRAVEEAAKRMPAARLHNLYGPTEAAIDVSYWPCSLDYPGKIVPIGKAVANTSLYIVDKRNQLQPIGVAGELCIGGVQLAERYHNRDDLTAKAFVADPFRPAGARMYRTGDLARYLPDGQIEYLDRIDNQIKLRGFRIELGEIEAVVQALPGVRKAAVVVHEGRGTRVLVGYVVADGFDAAAARAAREAMARQLPEFMIPQLLLPVADVPTTANGKLDRKALPDPFLELGELGDAALGGGRAAPANALEAALLNIWQEALGAHGLGVETNFFRVGGDSIRSIRVAARLRELGHRVAVQDVFAHPTVRQLARHLGGAPAGKQADAAAARQEATGPFALVASDLRDELAALHPGVEDAWPPSRLQLGMVYHSMMSEGSSLYHDIFCYQLRAPLRAEALARAAQIVSSRHAQLRSWFELDRFAEPLQLVTGEVTGQLAVIAASDRPDDELGRWVDAEKARPFELARPPLWRVAVQERGADALVLVLSFHHAILDGWSVALVVDELCRAYAALLAGKPVALEGDGEPLRYSAFVALERQAMDDAAQAEFWRRVLDEAPPPLLLAKPTDAAAAPRALSQALPVAMAERLQRVADQLGVPVKSLYLAVHLSALAASAGRQDAISGVVSNGRPEFEGGERMVGMFLATVPFGLGQAGGEAASWPARIAEVFGHERALLPYRRFPLAAMRGSDGESAEARFDVLFNYTHFHVLGHVADGEPRDGLRITGADYFEHTNFPVVVHASADRFTGRMTWTVNYDAARVEEQVIRGYLEAARAAAEELAGLPDREIAEAAQLSGIRTAAPLPPRLPARAAATRGARGARGGAADAEGAEELTPRQAQLLQLLGEALGAGLRLDDDVLALGLDSIVAIRLVGKLKRLGLPLFIQDLYDAPTARRLAERAEAKLASAPLAAVAAIPAQTAPFAGLSDEQRRQLGAGVIDAYPATALQLQMIEVHGRDVAAAVYHDLFSYRIELPLDEARLREALRQLALAHPALRTSFRLEATPPLQCVEAQAEPELLITDGEAAPPDAFDRWFESERALGFDLSRPPLRFFAYRHGATAFTLTLSFHHAILDGWSLSLLMRELVTRYRGGGLAPAATLAATGPSLRDYAHLAAANERDAALAAFWHDELSAAPSGLFELGSDDVVITGASAAHPRWSEAKLVLPASEGEAVARLAQQTGVPLKQALLAAHVAVLAQLAGRDEVLTATFSNGRPEEEGGEALLGMFLGFSPFRQRVAGHTWRSLCAATFATERRLLPYRRYPLSRLRADRRNLAGAPELRIDTIFNYTRFQAYADLTVGAPEQAVVRGGRWFEHTEFPLLVNAGHDLRQEHLVLTFDGDGHRFSPAALDDVAARYHRALRDMIEHPDRRVITARG